MLFNLSAWLSPVNADFLPKWGGQRVHLQGPFTTLAFQKLDAANFDGHDIVRLIADKCTWNVRIYAGPDICKGVIRNSKPWSQHVKWEVIKSCEERRLHLVFFTKIESLDLPGSRINRTSCGLLHQGWKAGGTCASYLVLIPGYDVGFTVLDAGFSANANLLVGLAIDAYFEALDDATRTQAARWEGKLKFHLDQRRRSTWSGTSELDQQLGDLSRLISNLHLSNRREFRHGDTRIGAAWKLNYLYWSGRCQC